MVKAIASDSGIINNTEVTEIATWCAAINTSPNGLRTNAPVLKILTSKNTAKPIGKPSFKILLTQVRLILSNLLKIEVFR